VDKLNLSRSNTPTAAETVRPEEWLELCYDSQPLDPLTSLATVRVRYSIGSEVPLTYRMIIRERL
jgi:hypothetical protein